ncbi:hypothetical protein Cpap_1194 [Ruminiclostridium papyrosolvens DSM 2782]|uniref:Uncharacterized protein n=1 Tax=Ruminiclostridium papyrosolvens DSM 2782 TaxID=588581 RepID=F1TF61_9FIRM|nr:hypothetical protein [Ruminiclostridium papyrosolvens]EGD46999.1 hypothetical protein Cpap_1194 [Ruminiclostridium papyrosolvens DSM 2782]WES33752.1 hypothetical protein P0092_18585 [Ruminiclostridium papyrosolvens DSM 2782]
MIIKTDYDNPLKLIKSHDEEIVRTVLLMVRMKNRTNEFRERLGKAYRATPDNIELAFVFGMFQMLSIEKEISLSAKIFVEEALEAFDNILLVEPGYWLVRILKAKLYSMLPGSLVDDESIINELQTLIELQKKSEYKSYFIVTYIMIADFLFSFAEKQKSWDYIIESSNLNRFPVDVLPDLLVSPLKNFENKLRISGETDMADKIKYMGQDLFGKNYLK